MKKYSKNFLITLLILLISFAGSLFMQNLLKTEAFIPSFFILSVLVVSLVTDGYVFGIFAALISVLAVNFAFTFPFFEFNFTIHENAVSAVIMIVVTVVTSTLTTQIKKQRAAKDETEREKMRANLLRAISHDLRTPLTAIYGAGSALSNNYDILSEADKKELLARIRAILRSNRLSETGKLPGGKFETDDIIINYDSRKFFFKGKEIKLTQTEYNILILLAEHFGKVLTYAFIIKEIWGYSDSGSIKNYRLIWQI